MKFLFLLLVLNLALAGNSGWNGGHPYIQEFKSVMKNIQNELKSCNLYNDPELKGRINQTQMELTISQTKVEIKRKDLLRDRYSNLRMARNYPQYNLIEFTRNGWRDLEEIETEDDKNLINERKRGIVLHEYLGIQEIEIGDYELTDLILMKIQHCLDEKEQQRLQAIANKKAAEEKAKAEKEQARIDAQNEEKRKKIELEAQAVQNLADFPESFVTSRLGFCKVMNGETHQILSPNGKKCGYPVYFKNEYKRCNTSLDNAKEYMLTEKECVQGFDLVPAKSYRKLVNKWSLENSARVQAHEDKIHSLSTYNMNKNEMLYAAVKRFVQYTSFQLGKCLAVKYFDPKKANARCRIEYFNNINDYKYEISHVQVEGYSYYFYGHNDVHSFDQRLCKNFYKTEAEILARLEKEYDKCLEEK